MSPLDPGRPPAADAPARPPIVLCLSDHDALERAALSALLTAPRVAGALLEEVDRAGVVADVDLPRDAVRLGSWVEFTDSAEGAPRRVRLVERSPPDLSPDELSVLTTQGAALVGLREGQTIVWPDRIGADRVLTVVAVRNSLGLGASSRRSADIGSRGRPARSCPPRRPARRQP